MANVKIVRATYLVIDGTTYKLIDEDVPNWRIFSDYNYKCIRNSWGNQYR